MAIRCTGFGKIYSGKISTKGNYFIGKKVDVTDEVIDAVAEHLNFKKNHENSNGYEFCDGNKLVFLSKDECIYKIKEVEELKNTLNKTKQELEKYLKESEKSDD